MRQKDGRAVAQENEIRVLRALHRFGWLRTRDLAAIAWQRWAAKPSLAHFSLEPPTHSPTGLRMAQRTLSRLRCNHQVLNAKAPDGSIIYALAERGARRLQLSGIAATTGKDLIRNFSSSHFRHRCIANEVAIRSICQGLRVSTEREISRGLWLGGTAGIAGKKPDVLLRNQDQIFWVEVERSRKNKTDYARLLIWLNTLYKDIFSSPTASLLEPPRQWGKVIFICTPAFQSKLCSDLGIAGWTMARVQSLLVFETSLYNFKDITFS